MGIVGGVRVSIFSGEAGKAFGANARGAIQSIDAQPGVVGEHRRDRISGEVAGLGDRILLEGVENLDRVLLRTAPRFRHR
jgi:hypothetical protein